MRKNESLQRQRRRRTDTARKDSTPARDPCKPAWSAYLEGLKESIDVAEAAKPLVSVMPVAPGHEGMEIRSDGTWAFRRLSKGKETEFEKFRAWMDRGKTHGL